MVNRLRGKNIMCIGILTIRTLGHLNNVRDDRLLDIAAQHEATIFWALKEYPNNIIADTN